MRNAIKFTAIFCGLVVASSAFSTSMSELGVSDFDKAGKTTSTESSKNPFASAKPAPQDLAAEDLYLNGVAIGNGKKYALINGYIFQEGDKVAGLVVKLIATDKVVLQYLDQVRTLFMGGGL